MRVDRIPWLIGLAVACGIAPGSASRGADAARDAGWQKVQRTSDGIEVTARRRPGAQVYEVRASCAVEATPATVFGVAMRRDSYDNSTKHVTEYRVVRRESQDIWYTYERLSFPLIRDRDYTLRYECTPSGQTNAYRIAWSIANEAGPEPKPHAVRITLADGALEIIPENGGKSSRLICTTILDPGGYVPKWLVNYLNRSTLPDLLRELRAKSIHASG